MQSRLLLLTLLAATLGWGQTTGALRILVLDAQKQPIERAVINLYLPDGNRPVAAGVTTSEGLYTSNTFAPSSIRSK